MATQKKKQPLGGETARENENAPMPPAKPVSSLDGIASGLRSKKNFNKGSPEMPPSPPLPMLYICRNKHWRYISAFHGPWLQMPIEILETIANINYNTPRPRPIDASVFFDILKVRRLVDEATNLAVRAASDIASPTLTSVHGGLPASSLNSLSMGPGHGAKLSPERKFRMREQASQKLARAYRLDEIACSVTIMQGASPLEDVGSLVLHRSPDDPDARYVHFFHEKIPSRQMAEYTSLQPLNDIIALRSGDPEVFRTRATVKIFKEDYEGAAHDLTQALSLSRFRRPPHPTDDEAMSLQEVPRSRRRPQDIILSEQDQPSGLDSQLLFHRASVYLTMACQQVLFGLRLSEEQIALSERRKADAASRGDANAAGIDMEADEGISAKLVESRKMVKTCAKRALRDYMAFIAPFEYSPNLPVIFTKDYNDRVNMASQGVRNTRPSDPPSSMEPHTVYSLSELFAAVPPADLPPYPSREVIRGGISIPPPPPTTCEWATCHPLLPEALHSLLLCHCLTQTSAKELLRHSYMVARLLRLADGYPIFQSSRCPARADWIEVIRRARNWIQLTSTWESLCAPAPLPQMGVQVAPRSVSSPKRAASAAAAIANGTSADIVAEEQRRDAVRHTAILDALDDERVTDEASFRVAVQAREARAEQERAILSRNAAAGIYPNASQPVVFSDAPVRRWGAEDNKEYPLLSERAAAVALWIVEAPVVTGVTKRKKRTKKPGAGLKADDGAESMSKLDFEEPSEA